MQNKNREIITSERKLTKSDFLSDFLLPHTVRYVCLLTCTLFMLATVFSDYGHFVEKFIISLILKPTV